VSGEHAVQPVLTLPLNPAAHTQLVWPVRPSVVDPAGHGKQLLASAVELKVSGEHAVQPVLTLPLNPAAHTQLVWPVRPSVVDPAGHGEQLPAPAAELKVSGEHAVQPDAMPSMQVTLVPANPGGHAAPVERYSEPSMHPKSTRPVHPWVPDAVPPTVVVKVMVMLDEGEVTTAPLLSATAS
jgi:hypothetical protein